MLGCCGWGCRGLKWKGFGCFSFVYCESFYFRVFYFGMKLEVMGIDLDFLKVKREVGDNFVSEFS